MPNEMKEPCNKCTVFGTYYEYPCYNCIHNPHSPKEILEDYQSAIFKQRIDRFTDYKFSGKEASGHDK